jgi:predicted metal-binding membrane protein
MRALKVYSAMESSSAFAPAVLQRWCRPENLFAGLALMALAAVGTSLKCLCHARCSSPLLFLMHNWRSGASGALRVGMLHGVECLGCCAGLMVGLVAVGMMNLAWMLTGALIIFGEKTLPSSHRMARPLGVVMVGGGVVLLATTLLGGMASGME